MQYDAVLGEAARDEVRAEPHPRVMVWKSAFKVSAYRPMEMSAVGIRVLRSVCSQYESSIRRALVEEDA